MQGVSEMTMSQPFFSIIIPALNEEKYLPLLLKDLSKQTFGDFEVIVVDGKSEDNTVARVKQFSRKLKVSILTSEKRNVSYQRNLGVKEATSNWIIFMDADNRLPDYFLDGIRYRIAETKCDCFTTYCNPDSDNVAYKILAQSMNITLDVSHFLEVPNVWGQMIGITKEGFERVGGFDIVHIPFEDRAFIRAVFKKGLEFSVFKDPKYIFSTRRYQTKGKLKQIQQYIELNLNDETKGKIGKKTSYEMGGQVYRKENHNK
jgi:glycosyltransferase involved in cell wall biosynthesis